MDVLKKLNNAEPGKPYHGLSKLSLGYHKIVCFRTSPGKFGENNVIAELQKEIIFLPQYLAVQLTAEDLKKLNECDETLFIYFGGLHEEKK